MFVQQVKIEGYSGFADSGWIRLSPKINVVVGTNNSGKSSLLNALSGRINENPHKSPQRYLPGDLEAQQVLLDLSTTGDEFQRRLSAYGSQIRLTLAGPTVADQDTLRERILSSDQITLKAIARPNNALEIRDLTFPPAPGQGEFVADVRVVAGTLVVQQAGGGRADNSALIYTNQKDSAFFHFPAERYHRAITPFGRYDYLEGNGSNLAGFLAFLQGNNFQKFEEVIARVRQVIPSIERVTIDPQDGGNAILIWPAGSGSNRSLAFSLETCGTGVSQVLAIFAAAATRSDACIIVDEVNSFLHPLAVKDLLSILSSEYPTNQYVLSSHSSDVIAHPAVSEVILVERDSFDSKVRVLNRDDISEIKSAMRQLGTSMTDVLGADSILWVEGPTEGIAFPNIIRDRIGVSKPGMQVVPVSSTGDFEGTAKDKRAVQRIFDRFLKVAAPLTNGQAFLFDREGLSDSSIVEFTRGTDNKLAFISRRCLENYVISPAHVAQMLSDDSEFTDSVSIDRVSETLIGIAKMEEVRGHRLFKDDLGDVRWLKDVDGAKLLSMCFTALSEGKYQFRKVIHTPVLLSMVDDEMVADIVQALRERIEFIGRMNEG